MWASVATAHVLLASLVTGVVENGGAKTRKRQKVEKKEKSKEEKAAERLAKRAADRERAARREATK